MTSTSALDNSMICNACQLDLSVGAEYLQCRIETCGKLYHYACNNKTLSEAEKSIWVCPECACAARKGGRNCDTPVGTPVNLRNVALRKPSSCGTPIAPRPSPQGYPRQSPEADGSMSMPTTLEIMLLREQIAYLTEQLADAVSAIGRFQSVFTTCTNKVETMSRKLEALERAHDSRCVAASSTVLPEPSDSSDGVQLNSKLEKTDGPRRNREKKSKKDKDPVTLPINSTVITQTEIPPADPPINQVSAACSQRSNPIADNSSTDDNVAAMIKECSEVPTNKKQRRTTSIRCTGGSNVTTLRAVEVRKYIHLWNMVSSADEVREYLQQLCERSTCTVEELRSKGEYKSYKLGVPVAYYDKCLSADVWPDNARVKMWFFRKQTWQAKQTSSPN
jgi:hypothetical protein